MKKYITIKEAAAELSCVPQHIYTLIARGRLRRDERSGALLAISVAAYRDSRRLKRKVEGDLNTNWRIPSELYARFSALVPGGSSKTACIIEAIEDWIKKKENR